jgi:hypothetical protein
MVRHINDESFPRILKQRVVAARLPSFEELNTKYQQPLRQLKPAVSYEIPRPRLVTLDPFLLLVKFGRWSVKSENALSEPTSLKIS